MKIYVGNLSYEVDEEALRLAFENFGQVDSIAIIKDKDSGRSKGFGFIEMESKDEGQSAIDELNGKELNGKAINVSEARARTETRGGRQRQGEKGEFKGGKGGYGGGKSGYGGRAGKGSGQGGHIRAGRGRGGDR